MADTPPGLVLFDRLGPPAARFDELIHGPNRLQICAVLDAGEEVEFSLLEEALGISTSLLSKQLRLLADAGYLTIEKRRQAAGRPRTWVGLTSAGRRAYRGHVAALRAIIDADPGPRPR